MEIKNLIDHDTFILGKTPRKDELIIPIKLVLKAKQTASGKLEKLKACIVAQGDMEKWRIKKTRATIQKQIQNKDKRMLKTTLQPQKQILYQLRSLKLLKTLGHHAHLQEGSNYSHPQLVHPTALWKVETLMKPISKLKSLAVTLSDFHWNTHITFSIPKDSSNPKLIHPILSSTISTINGFAFSFSSTTC